MEYINTMRYIFRSTTMSDYHQNNTDSLRNVDIR